MRRHSGTIAKVVGQAACPAGCGTIFRLQSARGRRYGPHSGAHILGSEAGEVINLFALAIRSGIRATDLKHMLFAYPTSGSNMTRML